ncbi:nucleoside triphosphate pyrophosphatase [Psychrobacter sp. 16-MNA-CIBAN-0192]|uniref:Maf family protein n=1 Tax=Psychrobacter sp. 16-MNA-CIBAN-0192 TaxID=3140448 RepID=UPI0033306400
MDILLASGSPRRRELLTSAQLDFTIISVDIDETPHQQESPQDYIERMVATKAEATVAQLQAEWGNTHSKPCLSSDTHYSPLLILTADTIGVLPDGKTVLVKPTDREHAYSMWQQMSDATHQVWTAVQATVLARCSVNHDNEYTNDNGDDKGVLSIIWQQHIIERTDVTFVPLTTEMMAGYWHTDEPADKAGGYGIQGLAAAWVTRINGSYTNVVGLPLAQTLALVHQAQHECEALLNYSSRADT